MPSTSFTLARRSFHFKNSGKPYGKVTAARPSLLRRRAGTVRSSAHEKVFSHTCLRARRDRGPGARRSAARLWRDRHRHRAIAPVVERPGLERRAGFIRPCSPRRRHGGAADTADARRRSSRDAAARRDLRDQTNGPRRIAGGPPHRARQRGRRWRAARVVRRRLFRRDDPTSRTARPRAAPRTARRVEAHGGPHARGRSRPYREGNSAGRPRHAAGGGFRRRKQNGDGSITARRGGLRFPGSWYGAEQRRRSRPRGTAVFARGGFVERSPLAVREATQRRLELLVRAGELFHRSLDLEQTLSNVARTTVESFADLCLIDLVDERTERLYVSVGAHNDPEVERSLKALVTPLLHGETRGMHPARQVAQTGEPFFVPVFDEATLLAHASSDEHETFMRRMDYRSKIVVPVTATGQVFGALTFVRVGDSEPFEHADKEAAQELGRRAGLAVANAKQYSRERATQRRLELLVRAGELFHQSLDLEQTLSN